MSQEGEVFEEENKQKCGKSLNLVRTIIGWSDGMLVSFVIGSSVLLIVLFFALYLVVRLRQKMRKKEMSADALRSMDMSGLTKVERKYIKKWLNTNSKLEKYEKSMSQRASLRIQSKLFNLHGEMTV